MKLRFALRPFIQQSVVMGLFLMPQLLTNMWTTRKIQRPTLDEFIVPLIGFAIVNFVIMLGGDRLARRFDRGDSATYTLLGAIAGSVMHAVALAPAAYVASAERGELTLLLAIPALLGAAAGFLLHRTLGYSAEGDDPKKLAEVFAEDIKHTASRVFASTDAADYYGGPLQVRDSSMAAIIASLIGAGIYVFEVAISELQDSLFAQILPPQLASNMALVALSGIIYCSLLFFVFVKKAHGFLQARGKTDVRSYVTAALVVPLGFALALTALMGPFGIIVVLPWILPSVAAIVTYHRLAGFEPLALPEDIVVNDPRTLISADHPRRRMRRVMHAGSTSNTDSPTVEQ